MMKIHSGILALLVAAIAFGQKVEPGGGGGGGGSGTIAITTNTLAGDGAGNAIAVTGTATNCVLVNGTSTACSGGSISGLTTNAIVNAASATSIQTPSATTTLDSSGNAVFAGNVQAKTFSSGSSAPTVCSGGTGGCYVFGEGTVPTGGLPAAGVDGLVADSTTHELMLSNNNATLVPVVVGPTSATSGHVATFSGTSGGILQDGGVLPTVTGGTCTNQVVTAISGSVVPTCTTVTSSHVNSSIATAASGGSLTTSGAFAATLTFTGATNVTFPTSGTLSTTIGTVTSIATTGPITGGTITSTGTIACATCVTSAASLTNNALMTGAGSQASQTVTTGTNVLTALGVNVGTAGAFAATNSANTGGASMTMNMIASTTANSLRVPSQAGLTCSASGCDGEDTTATMYHNFTGGVDSLTVTYPAANTITNNHCPVWSNVAGLVTLADSGSGGGGAGGGGGISGWSVLLATPFVTATTLTQYAPTLGGGLTSLTETAVSIAAPATATYSALTVSLSASLGTGTTLTVTLEDGTGTPSALTCVTSSGGTTCVDNTHSVNVSKGDLISFKLVATGTISAGSPQIQIGYAVGTSGVGITSVSFTGGLISVANPTTTPAFTVAGTSGGIPYFSAASTWASSGALASGAVVLGGGAGSAPTTTGSIVGANLVVASSPGAGLGHFAGSTQALTSSAVVSADLNITTTTCTAPSVLTALSATAVGTCTTPVLTQNSQSAAYTTVLTDSGKMIYHPGADTTARTWTIDSNANVAYPVGTCISFFNDTSAGTVTIAITSDTLVLAGTGTTGSRTLAASGEATACKMTTVRWMIAGNGIS